MNLIPKAIWFWWVYDPLPKNTVSLWIITWIIAFDFDLGLRVMGVIENLAYSSLYLNSGLNV